MAVVKPKVNKKISKVNFTNSNRSKSQIKYLVKHYVGAAGGAKANADFFYSTYRGASAHFFVGHDGEIWQVVEENDTAWHCGAKSYKHKECRNSNSIGVELCVKKDANGKWYYTEETKKAAVNLFCYLMDKYNIDNNHVLRHYDVTGKLCGEPDVKDAALWKEFKQAIKQEKMEVEKEEAKKTGKKPFQIKITCEVLNIRKGAGTKYPVTGKIKDKNTYTITEEKSGWGKLKSGAGWICLDYTKKV